MTISVEKVAPSAAVLAFVGYCIWPSLSAMLTEPPKPKPAEKVEELSAGLLLPKLPPLPMKNPWGGKDAAAIRQTQAEEAKRQEEALLAQQQNGSEATSGVGSSKKAAVKPEDILKSLTLEGTCIGGAERFAIINKRIYALNELVSPPDTGGGSLKLVGVDPYKVVLEYQGKSLDLKYSNASAMSPPETEKVDELTVGRVPSSNENKDIEKLLESSSNKTDVKSNED